MKQIEGKEIKEGEERNWNKYLKERNTERERWSYIHTDDFESVFIS